MTSRRLILILTLAIPLLLGWVVIVGEINRTGDSSTVHVEARAARVDETPFSAPMLELHSPLLESQPVPAGFSTGEDVFLRYGLKDGRWSFENARKQDAGQGWSADRIDIPARVVVDEGTTKLKTEPLLPRSFAVSRRTMKTLRGSTVVDLSLRRGRLGTVWVREAWESALPVGNVVSILKPADGLNPIAVGDNTDPIVSMYGTNESDGWMAPVENLQVGLASKVSGKPLAAVRVTPGVAMAVQPSSHSDKFAIRFGETLKSYPGTFLSFDDDGSFWSSVPDPDGQRRKWTRRSLDGAVQHEVTLPDCCAGAAGNSLLMKVGYELRRYTVEDSKPVLSDAWTIDGLGAACMARPDFIAAAGSEGVFVMTPGKKTAERILNRDPRFSSAILECSRDGDVLVVLTQSRVSNEATVQANLQFRSAEGAVSNLGVQELPTEYRNESEARIGRVLRIGDRLYLGLNGEMLIFDLQVGRLLKRINGRRIGEKRRIL